MSLQEVLDELGNGGMKKISEGFHLIGKIILGQICYLGVGGSEEYFRKHLFLVLKRS